MMEKYDVYCILLCSAQLEDLLSDKDFRIVELEDRVSTLETSKLVQTYNV